MVEEETEKRLNRSLPQFQKSLEGLHRSLPAEQSDVIEELEKLLKEGDLERFSELAKNLEKELSGRPDIQKLIEESEKDGRESESRSQENL